MTTRNRSRSCGQIRWPSNHVLRGAFEYALEVDHIGLEQFIEDLKEAIKDNEKHVDADYHRDILNDFELCAHTFLRTKENNMARTRARRSAVEAFKLPTKRRKPSDNPWQYAYLITGEKKIGKTTFAISGCEEYVLQFDKPQIGVEILETMITSWKHSIKAIKALEVAAEDGKFPYERVIIDGVAEWYAMCQAECIKHFGVEHPSELKWAQGWHWIRDNFTDAINRLLRLQTSAECGIIFIAHAEWQEIKVRGGGTVDKLVPNLSAKCEETVNGKVDGWFCYDYDDEDRVLVVRGNQTTGAGHRIDERFFTKDGRPVSEIYMGTNAAEGINNFLNAFNNKQTYIDMEEYREANSESKPRRRRNRTKKT